MIVLENVRKTFNAGRPSEVSALRGVSLRIASEAVTVLVGPSGSGKTTLLTIIGCMARPTAGRVRLGEREITSLPERFLTQVRRQSFGFVFQQPNLIKGLSVVENVMLPAYPLGAPRRHLHRRALDLLDLLQLQHRSYSNVEWLSGGEAQRAGIARALINDPEIIIADEPTAHLDTELSRHFLDIVAEFRSHGKTVIISSHDPLIFDSPVVDHVVRLHDGRLQEPTR